MAYDGAPIHFEIMLRCDGRKIINTGRNIVIGTRPAAAFMAQPPIIHITNGETPPPQHFGKGLYAGAPKFLDPAATMDQYRDRKGASFLRQAKFRRLLRYVALMIMSVRFG